MGSIVWKRRVTQKVLEKYRIKKKIVKSKLRSTERGRVQQCVIKLRSAKNGWVRSMQCVIGASVGIEELPS